MLTYGINRASSVIHDLKASLMALKNSRALSESAHNAEGSQQNNTTTYQNAREEARQIIVVKA